MTIKKSFAIILLLLATLISSCAPVRVEPTATPTPVPPTAAPRPSDTPAPSATATVTKTETPLPTLTATVDYVPLTLPKGPTLIYTGSDTAMRVFWQWTESTVFRFEWGSDDTYALGSADVGEYDAENHLYAFDVSGLQPGTRYTYRVVLNLSAAGGSFRTAPGPDESTLKFVSYGDTRTYPELHDAVAAQVIQLYQSDPLYQTFNLFAGDFVTHGDLEEDWQNEFFAPSLTHIRSLIANMAFLSAIGNHEGGGILFTRYFPLPYVKARYGSFDYGPVHIVIIDQYVPFAPGSNQYAWLEQDLAASSMKWKFIVLHEPGWSAGGGHDNNLETQALEPLFERSGVSIVFAGHNHYYARADVNGIQHLTIGTGGAPLYTPVSGMPHVVAIYQGTGYGKFEINAGTLNGWFIAADGSVIDTFTLER